MNQVVKRENESFTELTDSGFLYSELPSAQWHIGLSCSIQITVNYLNTSGFHMCLCTAYPG